MSWASMASPAIFAVIGDALPKGRRAMGFTLQSMLKRVPMAFAPLAGAALLASYGVVYGVRVGLVVILALALAGAALTFAVSLPVEIGEHANVRGVWRSFHTALKRLLVSDIIIRTCEGMADIFMVLYVTDVTGISLARYGALVAVQMVTSILVYIPAGQA